MNKFAAIAIVSTMSLVTGPQPAYGQEQTAASPAAKQAEREQTAELPVSEQNNILLQNDVSRQTTQLFHEYFSNPRTIDDNRSTPSLENEELTSSGSNLAISVRRLGQGWNPYAIPAGPEEAPEKLIESNLYRNASGRCGLSPSLNSDDCDRATLIEASSQRLLAGSLANPDCKAAVPAMVAAYSFARPSQVVSDSYDVACLGSLVPRSAGATDIRPSVLQGAEIDGRLLTAIGTLIVDRIPRCTGLLTSARQFITARHCGQFVVSGALVVQASSGASWTLGQANSGTLAGTPGDWAVYNLIGPGAVTALAVSLVQPQLGEPVTLLAAYPHINMPPAGSPMTSVMRFPRPGLCEAVYADEQCIQIICQTVKGFSGAPVFRASSSPDKPEVVGFISGSEGQDSGCFFAATGDSTLAVSSQLVAGVH